MQFNMFISGSFRSPRCFRYRVRLFHPIILLVNNFDTFFTDADFSPNFSAKCRSRRPVMDFGPDCHNTFGSSHGYGTNFQFDFSE